MDIVKVTDDTTRTEFAEALAHVCARAKRIPHVIGTPELPTEWDKRHAMIDALLTDWQQALL